METNRIIKEDAHAYSLGMFAVAQIIGVNKFAPKITPISANTYPAMNSLTSGEAILFHLRIYWLWEYIKQYFLIFQKYYMERNTASRAIRRTPNIRKAR